MSKELLVLIDGDCQFCRSCANYLRRHDRKKALNILSFDPEKHSQYVNDQDINSVLFIKDGIVFTHDEAVLLILNELGGFHRIVGKLMRVFPKKLRKSIYDWIAKRRKKLMNTASCSQ
jgi:predicted DCC family thiol-disulfide oxidoreductase YuxK